jgi:hypothetical protein
LENRDCKTRDCKVKDLRTEINYLNISINQVYTLYVICGISEDPKKFKLDRTAFEARTASKSVNYGKAHQKLTWQQRLKIHRYLKSIAYGYTIDNPPRMDKTAFSVRSRE